jgi:hypothetical protein
MLERGREIKRERMRNTYSAGMLYACKGPSPPFTGQREGERERERVREREREGGRERLR